MFTKMQTYSLALIIAFLQGCSLLHPKPAESVQELVDQNRYDQAIATYQLLRPEEQAGIDLQKIEKSRNDYERNVVASIQNTAKNNDYPKAEDELKKAIGNIPSSEALLNLSTDIEKQKQEYLKKNQQSYDVARAKFLIEEKPLLENLLKAKADDPAFMKFYSQHAEERDSLGESLGNLGLAQLDQKDQTASIGLLSLAQELKPDARWEKALMVFEQKQKKTMITQKEKRLLEEKEQKEKYDQAVQAAKDHFEADMVSGDLKGAQAALAEVNKLEVSDNPWQKAARQRLETTIDSTVKMAIKEGQVYYSKGEISKALKIWRAAQPFAPKNESLNDSIKRAETFQKNLINLSAPKNGQKNP